MQSGNRDIDRINGGYQGGCEGGEGWEVGADEGAAVCVKQMTREN